MRRHIKNITIIKSETDYEKVRQITKEVLQEELKIYNNEKLLKSSESNLENIICEAILKAKHKETEYSIIKKEEERKKTIHKRQIMLGVDEQFDEEGNPKTKTAIIKLIWKYIKCNELVLKDIGLLRETINAVVSMFFLLIEWALYLLSVGFILYGIAQPIYNYYTTKVFSLFQISVFISSLLYALLAFLISRLIIRTLKIECKYNEDSNYMLNFLAVIIAIIAIIISIVAR